MRFVGSVCWQTFVDRIHCRLSTLCHQVVKRLSKSTSGKPLRIKRRTILCAFRFGTLRYDLAFLHVKSIGPVAVARLVHSCPTQGIKWPDLIAVPNPSDTVYNTVFIIEELGVADNPDRKPIPTQALEVFHEF